MKERRSRVASRRLLLWVGCVLFVTLAVYGPALRDGFVWDDLQNITDNQSLRSWDGLKQIWSNPRASYQYYPLTYSSFWMEYHLWGLHPFGYHLVNVLLHALNALLLGVLLSRLSVPGAWLAALIFAVQPVHVESVAWITERKNVLSGAFCLASFLAWLRFTTCVEHRWRWYALSLVLFLCALLSKTAAVVLPVAIVLVLWWKQKRMRPVEAALLLPFFLLGAALGLLTVRVEVHQVGAQGPEWAMTLAERMLIAGRAVWFYAAKLLWPRALMFVYPRWQINPAVWRQYLFPAAAILVLVILWLSRQRIGKAPLVAVVIFICAAAPVPAFINVYFMHYSYVADHFQYLASMSLIALAAAGIARALHSNPARAVASGAVLLALGVLSWQRCEAFRDNESIWRDTLAKNPDSWMARNNLASIAFDRGKIPEAVTQFEEALRVGPDYPEAHYNLGLALERLGNIQDAIKQYQQAVQIKPDYAMAQNELGLVLFRTGEVEEAIGHFEQALQAKPAYAEAHSNLGGALLQEGKRAEAIAHFEQALQIKPVYAEAQNNLGLALSQEGRLQEAIAHFERALQIDPRFAEAHYNLGNALSQAGQNRQAIEHFEQAVRLKPDFTDAENELARLRSRQ